ncbi:MAG: hypothetical protein HY054_13495 [Proteobacteria bacterium]|nr:hypothetical protein [Pseudomonadota bacterium]
MPPSWIIIAAAASVAATAALSWILWRLNGSGPGGAASSRARRGDQGCASDGGFVSISADGHPPSHYGNQGGHDSGGHHGGFDDGGGHGGH